MAGEFRVTPVRVFDVDGERLQPGRDRFSPDHAFVVARPELFKPA